MPSAPYTPPLPGNRNSTRSPLVRGVGAWEEPVKRAKAIVAKMSLEDKVNLTTGTGWQHGPCMANTSPIPSIGYTGLCLQDGPLGVRHADFVTGFPASVNVASTWDRKLMRDKGQAVAYQHRTKGSNVQLGPMMNLGRVAQGGRNWEGFGADPYLAGEGAYETIMGIQSLGVQACAKHFVGNEQEHNRTTSSSNIDDKTMHEVYAAPFLRSIQANVVSVMCSYMNGTYACEDDRTLNQILKHEFGFQGYVMSDWQATMSTLSAEAGLDMTMPGDIIYGSNTTYFGQNLTDYVHNGTIAEERVTDMATRILAAWFLTGQDKDYPETNLYSWNLNSPLNQHVQTQTNFTESVAYEVAVASHILLKNVNHTLPLVSKTKKAPREIALIGSDAGPPKGGPNEIANRGGYTGTLAMGWGSGACDFSDLISPLEGIQPYAREHKTALYWTLDDYDLNTAGLNAMFKDVAIVFITSDSGEDFITIDGNEGDRKNLTAWHNGDNLVQTVAANNTNTIIVVHSPGPLILDAWVDHPNITAVIWAGLPGVMFSRHAGLELGVALADILYGHYNPSGKLPFTIARKPEDYNAPLIWDSDPHTIKQIPYSERVFIDYRHFDEDGIEPRYEFGFGLSYTTFKYSGLKITPRVHGNEGKLEAAWEKGNVIDTSVGASLAEWLHESAYHVTYTIKNTGSVAGHEVSQLYLSHPSGALEPPSILRGFQRTWLEPGESATVSHNLTRWDLSVWNTVQQGWSRPKGTIGVRVGASSRDFRLKGSIQ
ncbi:beta-glucosidase [Clavulina sp. PMI_390]|nr:beta-glucosidase [Clavulina sp. PMI_390]